MNQKHCICGTVCFTNFSVQECFQFIVIVHRNFTSLCNELIIKLACRQCHTMVVAKSTEFPALFQFVCGVCSICGFI